MSGLPKLEKAIDINALRQTVLYLLLCIIVILPPALISGYVRFDPKSPEILLIWSVNNFFFICMSEEVIFRGFLQRTFQSRFNAKLPYLPIVIVSVIFGLMHFSGGALYIMLSSACRLFFGYTYYKTNRILCSRIVHFGLNLTHFLLFTYPSAI